MVERQRGDVIFVGSDVALRQRPHMGAYGAAKAALDRDGHQPADGARGHRGARVDRASGSDEDRDGLESAAESIGPVLEDWAKWGQARHDYFLRASDLARAIAFVAETPRGGFVVSMEVQPEAPLPASKIVRN